MKKEITFSFPAEAMQGATEIYLLGDFNSWNIEEAIKFEYALDGFFRAVAHLEEGQTYHYRFMLDNGRWVNDHNAQAYVVIPELYVDNCVITVPVSVMENNSGAEKTKAAKHKETHEPEVSTPKTTEKSKKSTESDSKKKVAEPATKKESAQPAPKKATAKAEPAKAPVTDKTSTKATKPVVDAKKTVVPKMDKPVKEVKKSVTKSKK
ncbi:MAG: hypothetical protein ABI266_03080 [Ginsengibacter sp.]